jgi:hypothetical protein
MLPVIQNSSGSSFFVLVSDVIGLKAQKYISLKQLWDNQCKAPKNFGNNREAIGDGLQVQCEGSQQ